MPTGDAHRLELASPDLAAENLTKLRELLPAAFVEGRLDVDALRLLLGEAIDAAEEKYGLRWFGKARARHAALAPSAATLRPRRDDSEAWTRTANLLVEGDNLEVLKLLQKPYARRVRLIYIDPPYNTGKDFVYADDYRDSVLHYLRLTGQRTDDGAAVASREERTGRLHTDWLNMMYPRLSLARNLLRDDGCLFVSVDDHELGTLRMILDEIFGPECFVATIAWKKRSSPDARDTIGSIHDYILCYVKRSDRVKDAISKMPLSDARIEAYSNPDDDPRGDWASVDMTGQTGRATRDQFFDVTLPSGRVIGPPDGRSWGLAESTYRELLADGRIWFGRTGDSVPRIKRFLSESTGQTVPSLWDMADVGSNDEAKKEVNELMGMPDVFDTPKPVRLIERMLQIGTSKEGADIVLDFFAGSGTTGHAVMQQNARDGGNRRFILVQLPYVLDESRKEQRAASRFLESIGRPRNAAELTRERLRRAADRVSATTVEGQVDTGFRVFALDTSNIRPWNGDLADVERQLFEAVDNVVPGRSADDLLHEIVLRRGIDLSTAAEERELGNGTSAVIVSDKLFVCTAPVGAEDVQAIADSAASWRATLDNADDVTCVFRDSGFADDVVKTNLFSMLSQVGFGHVRTV